MTWKLSAPYGYTIFSDDVREEVGGKLSYIGVYGGGDMLFQGELPGVLPKLVLTINFFDVAARANEPFRLVVYFPGDPPDKPSVSTEIRATNVPEIPNEGSDDEPLMHFVGQVVRSPARFEKAGDIKVRILRGEEEFRLGRLTVSGKPAQAPATPDQPKPDPPNS